METRTYAREVVLKFNLILFACVWLVGLPDKLDGWIIFLLCVY